MNTKKTKILIVIGIITVLLLTVGFSLPFIRFIDEPQKLQTLLESYGAFAPIMFMLIIIIQTLIPFIPGEPFELLAGYFFGTIKGTILCLLAASIASIIIIIFVKKYGTRLIEIFYSKKDHEKTKMLQSKKAFLIYALIFVLPGTPKDLLCYIGGLADFDVIPLIIVTTVGRIPSIVTSTIPSDAIADKNYAFGVIVYGITILISIISLFLYNKYLENKKS